jgi:hypothetical protein
MTLIHSPALSALLGAAYAARPLGRGSWSAACTAATAAFLADPVLAQEAKTYYDSLVAANLPPQRDVIGNLYRTFLAEVL